MRLDKAFTLIMKGCRKCISLLRYVCLLCVVLEWVLMFMQNKMY